MEILKALILGIVQGLTEFLPVSSSGHIELGIVLFNLDPSDDLTFSLIVHLATVLSTILVFRNDILLILKNISFKNWTFGNKFIWLVAISMVPIFIAGCFFKDQIEALYHGKIVMVGFMLWITAALLLATKWVKKNDNEIKPFHAFLIGISQALAVIPGISRSGATISTGLLLGIKRETMARFSFLMVLLPIIGASIFQIQEINSTGQLVNVKWIPLLAAFVGAFLSGLFACKAMIRLVKEGNIYWFAIYCFIIGGLAIATQWV